MLSHKLTLKFFSLFLLAMTELLTTAAGTAQSVSILHSFDNNGQDGYHPWSGLTFDAQGNLYGTTTKGGVKDTGTVYKLSPNTSGGWTETIVHSFLHDGLDGYNPNDSVVLDSAGNIYGTTSLGGTGTCTNPAGVVIGCGTVFKLVPSSNGTYTEKILYGFKFDFHDGTNPTGGVILDSAGNLYGTTLNGGNSQAGTVYKLSNSGGHWTETLLWIFSNTDGAGPRAGVIFDSLGNLYGTTGGGGAHKWGTVFEVSPSSGGTWTETVLHTFNLIATDVAMPEAPLIFDAAGNLYGTASYGCQTGGGGLFELSPSSSGTWTESVLHCFNDVSGSDGYNPWSPVILDAAGNLYGTSSCGGTGMCRVPGLPGCGTIFELSPSSGTWTENIVYSFNFISNNDPEGPEGSGLIPDGKGNYYGTTYAGGDFTHGTVFEFTP